MSEVKRHVVTAEEAGMTDAEFAAYQKCVLLYS